MFLTRHNKLTAQINNKSPSAIPSFYFPFSFKRFSFPSHSDVMHSLNHFPLSQIGPSQPLVPPPCPLSGRKSSPRHGDKNTHICIRIRIYSLNGYIPMTLPCFFPAKNSSVQDLRSGAAKRTSDVTCARSLQRSSHCNNTSFHQIPFAQKKKCSGLPRRGDRHKHLGLGPNHTRSSSVCRHHPCAMQKKAEKKRRKYKNGREKKR